MNIFLIKQRVSIFIMVVLILSVVACGAQPNDPPQPIIRIATDEQIKLTMEAITITDTITTTNYVAFGDGGSVVIVVTPDEWTKINSPATLKGLQISVKSSHQLTNTRHLPQSDDSWEYWELIVDIQNTSDTKPIQIRPLFDSRLQGMITNDDVINFQYDDIGFETTDENMTNITLLNPGETIQGILIYKVLEIGDLYWIYGRSNVNEERVVFKVR